MMTSQRDRHEPPPVDANEFSKEEFWNNKILPWECSRYERKGLLGMRGSVMARMRFAHRLLQRVGRGCSILELGCGGGRIIPALMEAQPTTYTGVDFSRTAIDSARARVAALNPPFPVELIRADAASVDLRPVDICFSLGFLDWIDDDEAKVLMHKIRSRYFFHSYSEKQTSWVQSCHRLYVYIAYGHRTHTYVPRYRSPGQVRDILGDGVVFETFRSRELGFGAIAYRLPTGIDLTGE